MREMTIGTWLSASYKRIPGLRAPEIILFHGHRVDRFTTTGDPDVVQVIYEDATDSVLARVDELVQYADPGRYITYLTLSNYMNVHAAAHPHLAPVYHMGSIVSDVYRTDNPKIFVIGYADPGVSSRQAAGSDKIYYEEYQEAAMKHADPMDLMEVIQGATSEDIARVNVSVEKNTKGYNYSATVTNAHSVDEALAMVRQAMNALAAEYGQAPNANA